MNEASICFWTLRAFALRRGELLPQWRESSEFERGSSVGRVEPEVRGRELKVRELEPLVQAIEPKFERLSTPYLTARLLIPVGKDPSVEHQVEKDALKLAGPTVSPVPKPRARHRDRN